MRRVPVNPWRSLRKGIGNMASYKMVPAVDGLLNTFGCMPIRHSNMHDILAAQSLA